ARTLDVDDVVPFRRARRRDGRGLQLVERARGVMSPIDTRTTCHDLIVRLGYPVILVTGSYLGALSHTLTALHALRGSGAGLKGIVVSESADSAGLAETTESLQPFAGSGVPVYALPRLGNSHAEKWRSAPAL